MKEISPVSHDGEPAAMDRAMAELTDRLSQLASLSYAQDEIDFIEKISLLVGKRIDNLHAAAALQAAQAEAATQLEQPAKPEEPEDENTVYHRQKLAEFIAFAAERDRVRPGDTIQVNIGRLIGHAFGNGTNLPRQEFHDYYAWLSQRPECVSIANSVFTFAVPEIQIDVQPQLQHWLTSLTSDPEVADKPSVNLHLNQIARQVFGRQATNAEASALRSALEAGGHARQGKRYTIGIPPKQTIVQNNEPVEVTAVPNDSQTPAPVLETAPPAQDAQPETEHPYAKLFEMPILQKLVEAMANNGPMTVVTLRKIIPDLEDPEKLSNFKEMFHYHREVIERVLTNAGYQTNWKKGGRTKGTTYELRVVEIPPARDYDATRMAQGEIIEHLREKRRLERRLANVDNLVEGVTTWGLAHNRQPEGTVVSQLVQLLPVDSADEIVGLLDNLEASGHLRREQRAGKVIIAFSKAPEVELEAASA